LGGLLENIERTILANVGAVTPWIHGARWDDCLVILYAEAIFVTQIGSVAADVGSGTLRVVAVTIAIPVITSDVLAGSFGTLLC
jgi:hypothetical protein